MLVATEAGCHLGPEGLGILFGHRLVAAHAVTMRDGLMGAMLETKMLPGKLRALAYVGGTVAGEAGVRVMRLLVAPDTGGVARQMQGLYRPGAGDALVAIDAIDAVGCVRAMLKGMAVIVPAQTEHSCARRERERRQDDERERELHSFSQLRDARSSALASYGCKGVEAASTAPASSQPPGDR
jgi:hypothetical protein